MRRVVPPGAADTEVPYADLAPPTDRPWLALGMVSSVDGAVTVDGRSGELGGEGDLRAFRAVRALGDVVLVGARTAVVESYRPTWTPHAEAARAARGQPPLPELALVTGSGDVPGDLRALEDPERPPLLLTTEAGAALARERVGERARVVVVPDDGTGHVEVAAAVTTLAERGLPRIVCEGGPTLNHALLTAGVVDELFVTVAPSLVGQASVGLAGPPLVDGPVGLDLHELRVHGSELLCRYGIA